MEIVFEPRRFYVAPRKSVLFFAKVGEDKIRCYAHQDALIEPARGLREESDVFQRCLLAFDQHRTAIESAASRLIQAGKLDQDGGVTLSRAALALAAEPPLAALGAGEWAPRELETELGVRVLARDGRGVTVTEPGARFLSKARTITAEVEAARDEAHALRGRPAGPVSVAIAPRAGALLWAPLVTHIEEQVSRCPSGGVRGLWR